MVLLNKSNSALLTPDGPELKDAPVLRGAFAFRRGAIAGAAAFLVYWIVECGFASVLPWLLQPHYEYRPVHRAFTALLLLLYPAVGYLLGGICGWAIAAFAGRGHGRMSLMPASGSIALLLLVNVSILATFPWSRWLAVSALVSVPLLFAIWRWSGRSRSVLSGVAASPWTASLFILGAEYVPSDLLLAKSGFLKAAGMLAVLLAAALLVAAGQKVVKHWGSLARAAALGAATVAMLGVALVLRQSTLDYAMKPRGAAASSGPNVVLITMDTVRADHLSLYGYAHDTSPHLRDLAGSSTLYTRSIASSDVTLSTHGSLFTGQYASRHGAYFVPGSIGYAPLPANSQTLARIVAEHGYDTMGVVANDGFLSHTYGLDQGFQYYDQRLEARFLGGAPPYYLRWSVQALLAHFYTYPTYEKEARYAGEINRDVFPLLERARSAGHNFFLFVNYMDAHTPYAPPAPFDTLYAGREPHFTLARLDALKMDVMAKGHRIADADRNHLLSQYDGGIAYLDSQIDSLISRLKELGLYENTLLIITSDHGEFFGEGNLVGHEVCVCQALVHVPLLIKFPRQKSPAKVDDLVSSVDIMPTVLDQLGFPIPASVQGRSLLRPEPVADRPIFSESFADLSGTYPQFRRIQRAIYSGRFKYIQSTAGKRELYDLAADPGENRNLYKRDDGEAQALSAGLNQWQQNLPRRSVSLPPPDAKTLDRLRSLGYAR